MNKQVFVINGSGGSGKDTFVSLAQKVCSEPIMNYSSVDKVKHIAEMIGWQGGKSEKDRKFLSDLKLLCTHYNDMPFKSMQHIVDIFLQGNAVALFLHIREPEEIERAKITFRAKTILVKRDSIKPITSNMADANVLHYDYDIVIDNNGTLKDYKEKAVQFVIDLSLGSLKKVY